MSMLLVWHMLQKALAMRWEVWRQSAAGGTDAPACLWRLGKSVDRLTWIVM